MYSASKNRGLAFVTMDSEEDALAALTHLNSTVSLSEPNVYLTFSFSSLCLTDPFPSILM
jgi:RNA recognition motif-containing protein